MRKISIIITVLAVFGLVLRASAQSATQEAGLVVQSEPRKVVGQVVEEKVIVQNNGQAAIAAGNLEVLFPAELEFQFAEVPPSSVKGGMAVWGIPTLAPQDSFLVRYVLLPKTLGQNLQTKVSYQVSGQILTQTAATSQIAAPGGESSAPEVRGETALPRTGADLPMLVLIGLPIGLLTAKIRRLIIRAQ